MASARGRSSVKVSSSKKYSFTCGKSRRAWSISATTCSTRARAVAMPAHGLRPEAEGALRAAAPTGVERDVGMQQVPDEVVLDLEVALVDVHHERQPIHLLQRRAVGRAMEASVGAVGQARHPVQRPPLGDLLDGEIELGAAPRTRSPSRRPAPTRARRPRGRRRSRRAAMGSPPAAPRPPSRRAQKTGRWCGAPRGRTAAPAGARRRGSGPRAGRRPGASRAPARRAGRATWDTRTSGPRDEPGSGSRRRRRSHRTTADAGTTSSGRRASRSS